MKTEFVANISHEIRTPLAAIKAYTETLLHSFEDLDSKTLQEFLDIILKQSEHLESIVERLNEAGSGGGGAAEARAREKEQELNDQK